MGNHSQTSTKVISVSHRADDSDRIGAEKEFAYQLTRANQHLRRDIEFVSLSDQASVPDDGNVTPGLTGALGSWLSSNVLAADGAGVVATGYDHATGKTTTPDSIDSPKALSYSAIKEGIQHVYEEGGDVPVLDGSPFGYRQDSEFCYSSDVPIASADGDQAPRRTSRLLCAIQEIVTDFGKVRTGYNSPDAHHD